MVYHDVYDAEQGHLGEDQDESTGSCMRTACAVCLVELAKPALGLQGRTKTASVRVSATGLSVCPDLGFVKFGVCKTAAAMSTP